MFRKDRISFSPLALSLAPITFTNLFQAAEQERGVPWWVWVLIIIVLVALWLWWWLRRRSEEKASSTAKAEAVSPDRGSGAPALVAKPAPSGPDDLTRIEGIGPKISGLLQAAGITTFAQLALTDVSRLKGILVEAGLAALADPTTWPEQAGLASAGEWHALEVLQDELKGGRRV